jgi:hypothetical protein
MKKLVFLFACIISHVSNAQVVPVPFFNPNPIAYDPKIDVVMDGAILDVQAVVSADRKYVTLTMQPQLSKVVSIEKFSLGTGYVGEGSGILAKSGVTLISK